MNPLQSLKNKYHIVGKNYSFNLALEIAQQVAFTDLSVLIIGESGVGKEVFSKIIHDHSPRKHNPFLAINCGALPEGTINAELFGHEKGAFTGAIESRKGYFETANEGTIFLDEIGEMPLSTQAYLLRILETGEYLRVGSSKIFKTNVRIIAATNKNLFQLIEEKKFREDLFYRLNTVSLHIPSLAERKEDISLLFKKFANDFAEKYHTDPIILDKEASDFILSYPFPGNIRELKNVTERLSVLSTDKTITLAILHKYLPEHESYNRTFLPELHKEALPNTDTETLYKWVIGLKQEMSEIKKILFDLISKSASPLDNPILPEPLKTLPAYYPALPEPDNPKIVAVKEPLSETEKRLSLVEQEKEIIIQALKKHKGKRKHAAEELEISPRTLYRKIKDYNLKGKY